MNYIRRALMNITGHRKGRFPGAHPISFTRERLSLLRKHTYLVAEKTDGVRFLMYVNRKSGTFLINRKFLFVWCNVSLNLPEETLLDGEMIFEGGRYIFYVFDVLKYDGRVVMDLPLLDRLRVVHNFLLRLHANNVLQCKCKAMYTCSSILQLVTRIMPKLQHLSDGLIFTPSYSPYESTVPILKWKPAVLNSVDFFIKDGKCYVNDRQDPVASIDYTGTCVGECVWRGRWVMERVREDKTCGNSYAVYEDILRDIKDPVSIRELCSKTLLNTCLFH